MARKIQSAQTTHHRHAIKSSGCDCGMCRPSPELSISPVRAVAPTLLRGRTLVLLDHQNLCGGVNAPSAVVSAVWGKLKEFLSVAPTDDVVIALSSRGAAEYMTAIPMQQMRLVLGNGLHGASLALVDFIDANHVAARYDSVVIASGDGTLTGLALELRACGMSVCNVTSSLSTASRDLSSACNLRVRLKVRLVAENDDLAPAA